MSIRKAAQRSQNICLSGLSHDAQELLRKLAWPSAFPKEFEQAEIIETHISLVLVGESVVLKFKKPVHFPFVDNRSTEARWRNAVREVSLNRRSSEGVYLGVLPIALGHDIALENNIENPSLRLSSVELSLEPAVLMRRIAAENLLDARIISGRVKEQDAVAVGKRLSQFHEMQRASDSAQHEPALEFEVLEKWVAENFDEFDVPLVKADAKIESLVRGIENYSESFLRDEREQFVKRNEDGWCVDAHGDLRAEHVAIFDTRVSFIDCLEFNQELRRGDVLNDLAFLLSDLIFRERADLAELIEKTYFEASPDARNDSLLRFYLVYRFMVRGKIGLLSDMDSGKLSTRTCRYLALANRYAAAVPGCFLVVLCGKMGVGKSTLADSLAMNLGARVIQSDKLRTQEQAGEGKGKDNFAQGRYRRAARDAIYQSMLSQAKECLAQRNALILDASFSYKQWRDAAGKIAQSFGLPFVIVYCGLDEDEQRQRLRRRSQAGISESEGREELAAAQAKEFEIPSLEHEANVIHLDMNEPVEELLNNCVESLKP